MDDPKLDQAIERLVQRHALGKKMKGMLRRTPSGTNYMRGEYDRVAKLVGKESKTKISGPMARKMVSFSARYTDKQLATLTEQCERHKHAPDFGTIIKLLPIKPGVRRQLQLRMIKNKWRKERLVQTIRAEKATEAYDARQDDSQDIKYQGRQPRATKSLEALVGELHDDAIKWRHIWYVLEKQGEDAEAEDTVWATMSEELQADVKKLVKLLAELSPAYEIGDE